MTVVLILITTIKRIFLLVVGLKYGRLGETAYDSSSPDWALFVLRGNGVIDIDQVPILRTGLRQVTSFYHHLLILLYKSEIKE